MLLATLENGQTLSGEQVKLVKLVVGKGRSPAPSVNIINAFPTVKSEIDKTPRRLKHPQTGKVEPATSTTMESALEAVKFWQYFRNQVVHSERIVDLSFFENAKEIWEVLRSDLQGVPPLKVNLPIPLSPVLVTASFTAHSLLAKSMRDVLITYSKERRGHVSAPGPFIGPLPPNEMPPIPRLWVNGDW